MRPVWLVGLILVSQALLGCTAAEPRPPNVLIILTDDQGTLDVNCYGSTDLYTPHMDRLAAEGVRFTQAYAHTVCCPTRAALMTGRHPQRSGVNSWTQNDMKGEPGVNMALAEVTLAEALRDAGYRTALFGKWHLGAAETHGPTKQGFDTFFGHRGGFIDNYNHHFLHGKGFHDLYEATTKVFKRDQYFPDLMTQRTLDYIEQHKDEPFFVFYSMNIPHYPEQSDPKFDERYKNMPMPRRSYAKMVSTTDDRIGQVLAKLDELNLTDDTIIVFMSDNGHSEENNRGIRFDDHTSGLPKGHYYLAHGGGGNTGKWRGSKGTFYEGGIRVPMMIRYPKWIDGGLVRDDIVSAMDIMPTVLNISGVDLPGGVGFDGQSLVPMITIGVPNNRKVMHWQWQTRWAVRADDWKLIGDAEKSVELVNLAEANPEQKDHLADQPAIAKQLLARHRAWLAEVTPKASDRSGGQ
ncbi:MAG: sulfatase-like hydrolase/transferase [Planctomycetota bacterium]